MKINVVHILLVAIAVCLFSTEVSAEAKASRSTFMKLMDIQELWEEDKFPEAIAGLNALIESVADKPYDFALANQYLAHTVVMMGENERARAPLEAALARSFSPIITTVCARYWFARAKS